MTVFEIWFAVVSKYFIGVEGDNVMQLQQYEGLNRFSFRYNPVFEDEIEELKSWLNRGRSPSDTQWLQCLGTVNDILRLLPEKYAENVRIVWEQSHHECDQSHTNLIIYFFLYPC
jgi:hypothetical protein